MGGGLYRTLWVDLYGLSQPEAHDKGFGPVVRSSCCLQSAQCVRLVIEERANRKCWCRQTLNFYSGGRQIGKAGRVAEKWRKPFPRAQEPVNSQLRKENPCICTL